MPNVHLEHAATRSQPTVDVRVVVGTVALGAIVIVRLQLAVFEVHCVPSNV